MSERISPARRTAFALGSLGYGLGDRLVVAVLIYFYLPPDDSGLPELVPAAWFSAAMIVGRIVDTLADPIVGHASDRSRARLGRRRAFLAAGILPMIGFPLAAFFPPAAPGSAANGLWLAAMLVGYFTFFTIYVAPYLALVPEIATTQQERVGLLTLLAVVGIPGAIFGFSWSAGIDLGRAHGLDGHASIRAIALATSALALALCLLPIAVVDERRFGRPLHAELSFREALLGTLRNRPFRIYLGAQLLFIFGVNLLAPILPYIAEVVLGRSPGFAMQLGVAAMGATLVAYPAVMRVVGRVGPKRTLVGAVSLFGLALLPLGLLAPDRPGGPGDARNLAVVFGSLVAIGAAAAPFYVVPGVIIGQLVDADAARTGSYRSAMFFGVQGLVTKWMYGVSSATLAGLFAWFGKSAAEPGGVLLAGPVAGVACLVAAALYTLYPEREVLEAARLMPDPPTSDRA
jgi:GPH family glycoside/pentoside/hexuronide:cation symporter